MLWLTVSGGVGLVLSEVGDLADRLVGERRRGEDFGWILYGETVSDENILIKVTNSSHNKIDCKIDAHVDRSVPRG